MAKKGKEATPHLRLRIEPRLLTRLEKAREKSRRTLTGEIVDRLEQSFRKEDDADLAIKVARGVVGLYRAQATAKTVEEIDDALKDFVALFKKPMSKESQS